MLSLLLAIIMLLLLCSCSKPYIVASPDPTLPPATTPEPVSTPEPQHEKGVMTVEEQTELIESLKNRWLPGEDFGNDWYYAITDLDHNGRMEVICASLQGTGLYTYAEAWELNEDFSAIERITYDLAEGESGPDIVENSADCYYDASTGLYHYVFDDTLRLGPNSHCITTFSLTLENGCLVPKAIASYTEEYSLNGDVKVQYKNDEGKKIEAAEYDSSVENEFAGLDKTTVSFNWVYAEMKPASEPSLVFAEDVKEGAGFFKQQCSQTGVYDFAPINSEGIEWEVYILDEEFTDTERFIPQAYECALKGSGRIGIKEGQWIYVYCPCNSFTAVEPPERCAFSWGLNPDVEYYDSEGNTYGDGPDVVITKSPGGECIPVGGSAWFIAHADNASVLTWQFLDTGNVLRTLNETIALNPGLSVQVLDNDTLAVTNVPASLNGWSVRAYFEGTGKPASSNAAEVYVGDFLTTYYPIIEAYKTYYYTKNGNVVYTSLNEAFAGSSADNAGVGYFATEAINYGYYLTDLNSDGIPEFIIGSENENCYAVIIDMFTIVNGQVKRVIASSDRCIYKLREDSYVSVSGSGGASDSSDFLLGFNGTAMSLVEGVEFISDGVLQNYYRVTDTDFDNSNDARINQSEYKLMVQAMHQYECRFPLVPIA